jgi:hypothetical protein
MLAHKLSMSNCDTMLLLAERHTSTHGHRFRADQASLLGEYVPCAPSAPCGDAVPAEAAYSSNRFRCLSLLDESNLIDVGRACSL